MAPYSSKLMNHFLAPRNGGRMEDADATGHGSLDGRAPYTEIYLKVTNGTIERAGFTTFGCGVSIACASVATELLCGKPIPACLAITDTEICDALDGVPPEKQFCAEIVVRAIQDAVFQIIDRQKRI
jgi:nitrogen fixation NifU-like protein